MNINPDDVDVSNNEAEQRYEARVDGRLTILAYQQEGGRIVYTHTEVPVELEGHGIAGKLTQVALDDARAGRLTVVPRCPYVAGYIQRHPEYQDLVSPDA